MGAAQGALHRLPAFYRTRGEKFFVPCFTSEACRIAWMSNENKLSDGHWERASLGVKSV